MYKKYDFDDPNLIFKCKVHGDVARDGLKIRLKKVSGKERSSYNYECRKCNGIRKRACRNKKNDAQHQVENARRRREKLTDGYVKSLLKYQDFPIESLTQPMIDLKRTLMKIKREVKK